MIAFVKKKLLIVLAVLLVLVFTALGGVIYIITQFKIDTIQVTGNVHYTDDQIKQIVMDNDYIDNSLLLYWKRRMKPIEEIPFVEKLDIEYISRHVITITVYEKSIAGCIEYMNHYVYFDKDGIVLETSAEKLSDIPCVSGMKFGHVVLYERLPIEDEKRFSLILSMTQMITKYKLTVDDVRFTSNDEVILYCGGVKVLLGDGSNIEDKMVDLGSILSSLGDKNGTLDMKDFTREKGNASFRADKTE